MGALLIFGGWYWTARMKTPQDLPEEEIGAWLEREVAGCEFQDEQHGKRLRIFLGQLSQHIGGSIPFVCQDWTSTKAAYGFLSNERVSEEKILAGHFACTRERFLASRGAPVLMLRDTTEFIYRREEARAIGIVSKPQTRYDRPRYHTTRGVLMHSSLVVTEDGLPLGLAAIKFWTRDKFHGANALKRRINPTRVPIEQKKSYRWRENLRQSTALLSEPQRIVHIGDRDRDLPKDRNKIDWKLLTDLFVRFRRGRGGKAALVRQCAGRSRPFIRY